MKKLLLCLITIAFSLSIVSVSFAGTVADAKKALSEDRKERMVLKAKRLIIYHDKLQSKIDKTHEMLNDLDAGKDVDMTCSDDDTCSLAWTTSTGTIR